MFIPENEQGVIVLFSQICEDRGWEIVKIQTRFPDAIIKNKTTGIEYRAEFEFEATSFVLHGHSPEECDLIICWKNDLGKLIDLMPVWELSNWESDSIVQLSGIERENIWLQIKNRNLEKEIARLKDIILANKEPESLLTENEIEIVKWAIKNNEGYVSIREISENGFCDSSYKVSNNLLRKWTARGWVTKDRFKRNSRRISDSLHELVIQMERGEHDQQSLG